MRSIDADIAYLDGFLKAVEIVAGRRGRTPQLMAGVSESVRNDLEWQLEECLGLMATGIGDDQPLHPSFHCPLQRVLVDGETERLAPLIQFEKVVVVLFCDSRT